MSYGSILGVISNDISRMDLTPEKHPRSNKYANYNFTHSLVKVSDSSAPPTPGLRHIDISYESVNELMKEIKENRKWKLKEKGRSWFSPGRERLHK